LIFEIYCLAQEILVFDQEHIEGVVSVSSFLVSRRLARLFIEDILIPLIFSVTFYFMAGFRHLASPVLHVLRLNTAHPLFVGDSCNALYRYLSELRGRIHGC
jgi:hypothetical protein